MSRPANTPWWRGGILAAESPSDAEMNRTAVASTTVQVEERGHGIYRLMHIGLWADFRVERDGSACYVAGNINTENEAALEELAAQLIIAEGR